MFTCNDMIKHKILQLVLLLTFLVNLAVARDTLADAGYADDIFSDPYS